MKRLFSALLAIALAFAVVPVVPAMVEAASQSDLAFELNEDGESYSVTDCVGSASGSLAIPATYNGKPVTSIGNYAFYRCSELTDVTIPKSVISIGDFAFWYCSKLISVSIPDSVISIGRRAFQKTKLSAISLPDSVKILGSHAFCDCTRLTEVSIGTNITNIDEYTFFGCKNLTVVELPENVNNLGFYAFNSCTKLTTVIINCDSINIDYGAFYDCNTLKDVWYSGSIADRDSLTIDGDNQCFENATWHYNYCGSENHDYDNACDINCNACGFERSDIHVYLNDCDIDCNECGEVRIITHTYDHNCDPICNICAYERSVPDHIYTNGCDNTCNECGANRYVTHIYDYICDDTCNICNYKRDASHIYDNANDLTCNVCKATLAPKTPRLESATDTTVTLVAVDGYEYSKDGTAWQKSNVFTGLQPYTSYDFYQRVAESPDNLASPASLQLTVTTDKYTPGIPGDFTFLEITDASVTFNQVTDCEYSMDGIYWQSSPVFTNLTPGTQYTFYQRVAEGERNYASDKAVLHITTYSKLGALTYDPNGGTGAPQTTIGQISTQAPTRSGHQFIGWALTPNTYAVYKPGDSYSQQEDITLYAVWAELCDTCNGEAETFHRCYYCGGTGMKSERESCYPCGGKGSTYNKVSCPVDFCYSGTLILNGQYYGKCATCGGDGVFEEPATCSSCNGAGGFVYTYDCEGCSGKGSWYSDCTQCTSGFQLATPEAPQMPQLQSVSDRTVVLVHYSTCEYSLDGAHWQDSNVFSDLDANEMYAFYQRYKATSYTHSSNASSALRVTTLKGRALPPQPPVLQSKTFNKVVLEKVSGCEYSLDGVNWQTSNVFEGLLPLTSYTFYCRLAETSTHLHSAASDGLMVTTEDAPVFVGDLNRDLSVDEDDVIYLLWHLLLPEEFAVNQPVDYDRDSNVDVDDVIFLLQYLLMPEQFPI